MTDPEELVSDQELQALGAFFREAYAEERPARSRRLGFWPNRPRPGDGTQPRPDGNADKPPGA